jgi:hypothetical protein
LADTGTWSIAGYGMLPQELEIRPNVFVKDEIDSLLSKRADIPHTF